MESPTVSVILPTFNRAHLLGRAIKSVLKQTYLNFELIVVDDGSTDNTEEVVNGFNDIRIKYIKYKTNKGAAVARNTGIKLARGKYIAFQDSDDEWLPQKLEKQLKIFETAPQEFDVVYTDMLRVNENGCITYWHSPEITYGNLINKKTSDYQVSCLGIVAVLVKKECFKLVGLFDEKFPRFIDLDLLIRLSKLCYFYHIKEPLVKYYATEGISTSNDAGVKACKLLLAKYWTEAKRNLKFLSKQYFKIGHFLCLCGDVSQGRKYFIKAFWAYPLNIKALVAALVFSLGKDTYQRFANIYLKIKKIGGVYHSGNFHI